MEFKNRGLRKRCVGGMIVLLILLVSGGCFLGRPPDYTLTVVVDEGVSGIPDSGQYVHQELSAVEFNYVPVNPLHTVEVLLNDTIKMNASGTIVMYGDNYVLKVRVFDVRGTWDLSMKREGSTEADYEFSITLTGPDVLSGTFTDSRGYTGTWSGESNVITLTYLDWADYVLTGTLYTMSGTFTGEETTGTWSAK